MAMQSLLNPRSIAIVGASDKIGPGFNAWKALEHVGYQGPLILHGLSEAQAPACVAFLRAHLRDLAS